MAGIQEKVDTALRNGDYFRAYDLATSALNTDPADVGLQYSAVLALARTGANYQARARLSSVLGLANPKNEIPQQLAEDFAAMDARLLKNLALEENGEKRRVFAARSALAYEAAYALKAGHFPAVNAATMWLIADEPDKSRKMAVAALNHAAQQSGYWPLASTAEAHLLLGQRAEARKRWQMPWLRRPQALRTRPSHGDRWPSLRIN